MEEPSRICESFEDEIIKVVDCIEISTVCKHTQNFYPEFD